MSTAWRVRLDFGAVVQLFSCMRLAVLADARATVLVRLTGGVCAGCGGSRLGSPCPPGRDNEVGVFHGPLAVHVLQSDGAGHACWLGRPNETSVVPTTVPLMWPTRPPAIRLPGVVHAHASASQSDSQVWCILMLLIGLIEFGGSARRARLFGRAMRHLPNNDDDSVFFFFCHKRNP